MANIQEVVLSVPDMSCDHCVHAIKGALGGLSGVQKVDVDLNTKTVRLDYQPDQVSMKDVEAALDDAGYTVAH
ncbi:heavy-metal-associated domain-containing protein [Thermosporothrix hazakensis]|uniref:HMA domain-containing protein n=1 Tax=Thermosporothrix sp. COM3 TaxID=2490863 RepID=A0A455SPC2_9CHLR|nr:copper ion binding protein [Thermosporothrix hazakensis]BBH89556.1 hypothetical protein KTC_43070 [Thermosporothrix sp. COM3]GCE47742.1 hypothetical protein KTH_26110 [Thermosporothrix hazakensis]